MLTNARFIDGTMNEALSRGDQMAHARQDAMGYQRQGKPIPTNPAQAGQYNGGIYAPRISRLQKGDVLFHFSDSKRRSQEEKYCGKWWFDMDCFYTIRRSSRMQDADFTSTARTLLGVLYEWGDMKNFVSGRLTADFWCYKGLTGPISGKRQKMSGPVRDDMVQIFVPGGLSLAYFDQQHNNVLKSGIV